jgi:uncharacterized protein (UPF0276 family)
MRSSPPVLGHGLGIRPSHWEKILEGGHDLDWFEIISENFMDTEGKPLALLEKARKDYSIVCHGVSMSIGSVDPLNQNYLKKLKALFDRIQPAWFSDHLCWTGVNQLNTHDLLPLPQTPTVVEHIVNRIDEVQNYMGRKMLIENVSSYVSFKESTMTEWDFISDIAKRSGCGILLDINNIYVNAFNHGFNALDYLEGVPAQYVSQFHLAGHTNNGTYLVDTHSAKMLDATWDLYRLALQKFKHVPTMVEWDAEIPTFDVLLSEINRAKEIEKSVLA